MAGRATALELAVANAEEPNCQSWQPTVAALITAVCGGDAGAIDQHWCVRAFPFAPFEQRPSAVLGRARRQPTRTRSAAALFFDRPGLAARRPLFIVTYICICIYVYVCMYI
jgi:hypothetical protein